ncbi:aromatic ring-hydroxylating dioxygenase subunit alpha [Phormidium tenue FACHB-886]|nr:aromatic ring-hydroxylating dioxygenase subunit alpha [Phormidium tenue FACHB-886]
MQVMQHPVFRRFWYPVMPIAHLSANQPQSFELLGQKLALWLDQSGKPAAVEDRCCHRSAKLSKGEVIDGNLRCPYHGWVFNGVGTCVKVPQCPNQPIPKTYCVQSFHCTERYGYAWVCLDEPIASIPEIPEAADPDFRLIHEFYEPWQCSGLRMMENAFDGAHPHFVHANTFGDRDNPVPPPYDQIEETATGLHVTNVLEVLNPALQQQNLRIAAQKTLRSYDRVWYLPFTARAAISYPTGLTHVIVLTATPINDQASQLVQFCLRNDTETDAKASDVIAFDRAVTLEDRAVLESTDPDVELASAAEQHMVSDKPGILMRQRLATLLKTHAEAASY